MDGEAQEGTGLKQWWLRKQILAITVRGLWFAPLALSGVGGCGEAGDGIGSTWQTPALIPPDAGGGYILSLSGFSSFSSRELRTHILEAVNTVAKGRAVPGPP